MLTRRIAERELALSGSEQNPDLTGKDVRQVLGRARGGLPGPVQRLVDHGADVVVDRDLRGLVSRMNALLGQPLLDHDRLERQVVAHDREVRNPFAKDLQVVAVRGARRYLGDRLIRTAAPHRLLLSGRVFRSDGDPLPGLYAAGEVAGFGGGGMHGYRSLEGTFLGGCLFSGRQVGRAVAAATG
jgi:uncharacterized protein